jgi:hypothetical protein
MIRNFSECVLARYLAPIALTNSRRASALILFAIDASLSLPAGSRSDEATALTR